MNSALALLACLSFVLLTDVEGFKSEAPRKYVDKRSIRNEFKPLSSSCAYADDYFNNRTQEFNLVSSHKVLNTLKRFCFAPEYDCINPNLPRVLLKKQRFSSKFQTNLRIGDWCLSDGCVVQSFTTAYQETFPFLCNSTVCQVTVKCIAPVIWMRYEYGLCGKGDYIDRNVFWKFIARPRNVRVTIKRSFKTKRVCELREIDWIGTSRVNGDDWGRLDKCNKLLAINNEVSAYPEQEEILEEFMKNPLLENFFMEEAKLYAYQVIREAFYNSNNLFRPLVDLHSACDELRFQGEATKPVIDISLTSLNKTPPPLEGKNVFLASLNNTPPPLEGKSVFLASLNNTPPPLEGENQTTSFSTSLKDDTENIGITVNVNINTPPYPFPLNEELFSKFLQFLNISLVSTSHTSLPMNNKNVTVPH